MGCGIERGTLDADLAMLALDVEGFLWMLIIGWLVDMGMRMTFAGLLLCG